VRYGSPLYERPLIIKMLPIPERTVLGILAFVPSRYPKNKERKEKRERTDLGIWLRSFYEPIPKLKNSPLRLAEDADPEKIKREDWPWNLALCKIMYMRALTHTGILAVRTYPK
jgi:hypothetical protein